MHTIPAALGKIRSKGFHGQTQKSQNFMTSPGPTRGISFTFQRNILEGSCNKKPDLSRMCLVEDTVCILLEYQVNRQIFK